MLVAAGSLFGLFLLSSLYLQNVLGTNPLLTGLAFIPLALAAGAGAHAAGHVVSRHGVHTPLVSAFLIAAAGMALLAHVGEHGTYLRNILPGMLVAGFGLGIAVVSVSISVMTGTREDESGMISGLNSTGHEIGGTIGIAVFSTIAAGATGALGGAHAASGISHAFIAAGALTALASLVASSSSRTPATSCPSSASTPRPCRSTERQRTPTGPGASLQVSRKEQDRPIGRTSLNPTRAAPYSGASRLPVLPSGPKAEAPLVERIA